MAAEEAQRKKQRMSEDCEDRESPAAAAPPGQAAATAGAPGSTGAAAGSKIVLVWDLDETLLLFNSLLTSTYAAAQRLPEAAGHLLELGGRWERAILTLCDSKFFFGQLEELDQTCLAAARKHDDGAPLANYSFDGDGFPPPLSIGSPRSPERHAAAARPAPFAPEGSDAVAAVGTAAGAGGKAAGAPGAPGGAAGPAAAGAGAAAAAGAAAPVGELPGSAASRLLDAASLRKLAYRYRCIAKLAAFGLSALGTAAQRQEWESLYAETDAATGGWLSHGVSLLAASTAQLAVAAGGGGGEVVHVAVTSGQLVPSIAKLLVFKLSPHISAEHCYSSRWCGKQSVFEAVRERFGAACTFVAIGDGIEEDEAAAALGWPYIRVLLAPPANYPEHRVNSWRPDAATNGPGLPFTDLTVQRIIAAAGLADAAAAGAAASPFCQLPPRSEVRGHLHGSSVALAALAGSSSGQELAGSEGAADGGAAPLSAGS